MSNQGAPVSLSGSGVLAPMRVAAGVIIFSGKVLLAQRGPGARLALKWEFPGGKIEVGESVESALAREIWEELALRVEPVEILGEFNHQYDWGEVTLIAVLAHAQDPAFVLKEHQEARWVEIAEIPNYDLAAADWPIVRALQGLPRV